MFEYCDNYFWYLDKEMWKMTNYPVEEYEEYEKRVRLEAYGVSHMLLQEFIEMIKKGKDPNKTKRIKAFKKSVANSDGTSGKKAHEYITKSIL